MQTKQPKKSSGGFHWNTAGWFGGQIGGTAYLLPGAVVLASRTAMVAAVWLAAFVVANVIGTWLWMRRDRLAPYPAIHLLLLVCGVCGLVAWLALDLLRPDVVIELGWARRGYYLLLIVPTLMAQFAMMEYSARKSQSGESVNQA